MSARKATFTVCLDEDDIQTLKTLAHKNDLPPSVMARVLLLRSMRAEAVRLEVEAPCSVEGVQGGR